MARLYITISLHEFTDAHDLGATLDHYYNDKTRHDYHPSTPDHRLDGHRPHR
jgi:hypothetical protein